MNLFGVDLIPPCLTVALTSTQVLPIDGANCKATIFRPSPKSDEGWPGEPSTMNL